MEPWLWLGNVGSWVVSFGRAVEVMGSEIEGKEPIFFFFFPLFIYFYNFMGISETNQPQISQLERCATKNQHEFEEVSTELKFG